MRAGGSTKTMSQKKQNTKIYRINKNLTVVAWWENTSYGFRHLAEVRKNGWEEIGAGKETYYNRTWESYEYQTAINKAIDNTDPDELSDRAKKLAKKRVKREALGVVKQQFATTAGIAKLGELFAPTQAKANDWKARMLKAGLPGLQIPEDWDQLSEDEKTSRLDKVITEASAPIN